MTPPQAAQLAVSGQIERESAFQKQVDVLRTNCKTIRALLVEGILKREQKFTQEELEEAEEAWMRG